MTILLCIAAFACLALSMERHQEALFRRALNAGLTRGLRIAGWIALVLALRFIVDDDGWGLGLVRYSGCTSFAAGIVFGALIVYERIRPSQTRRV